MARNPLSVLLQVFCRSGQRPVLDRRTRRAVAVSGAGFRGATLAPPAGSGRELRPHLRAHRALHSGTASSFDGGGPRPFGETVGQTPIIRITLLT